jgi:hypothetical protein
MNLQKLLEDRIGNNAILKKLIFPFKAEFYINTIEIMKETFWKL